LNVRGRTKTEDVQTEAEGEGDDTGKPYRVRNRKSVSYREVPVDEIEEDVDVDDEELTDQADDLCESLSLCLLPAGSRSRRICNNANRLQRAHPPLDHPKYPTLHPSAAEGTQTMISK
jgi:hypothetical protein